MITCKVELDSEFTVAIGGNWNLPWYLLILVQNWHQTFAFFSFNLDYEAVFCLLLRSLSLTSVDVANANLC